MKRRLREIGGSYAITIPKQVCDLYSFKPGDLLEIEPINTSELRLRKKLTSDANSKKAEKAVEHIINNYENKKIMI